MWWRSGLMLCVLLAKAAHAAPSGQKFEYRTLERAFSAAEAVSDYRYVSAVPVIRRLGNATMPIEVVIRALDADIALEVALDGSFKFPFSEALSSENPQIWTNLEAKDQVRFEVQLRAAAPGQREFDYGLLELMRVEFRTAYSAQGVFARFRAPSTNGLILEFAPNTKAEAVVQTPAGEAKFRTNQRGEINLPERADWIAAKLKIVLSAMPTRIRLDVAQP